jgi:hypothetical protein
LEGTDEPITVDTNHRNLEYWQKANTFNRRHARWYQLLAPLNFNIHYRPGKMSDKPDALSRRHDHADITNPAQTMLGTEKSKGFLADVAINIISGIMEAQQEDESLAVRLNSTVETLCLSVQWLFLM